jgi:hypothetical protein
MSGIITEIYDVSFIKLISNTDINIGGNSLLNVGNLNFINTDNFLYYKNQKIFDQSVYSEAYKFDASLIDVSSIQYKSDTNKLDTHDICINNISCEILNINKYCFINNDISFNHIDDIYNYKSKNSTIRDVSCNLFNSYEVSANNIDLHNLNIYNTCFKLNKDDKIKINGYNIITYDNSMIIGESNKEDVLFSVIYGTLKCNTISLTPRTFDRGNQETSRIAAYFGNVTVGYLNNTSDDRLKHNETSITNALETICKIKPKTYIKNNSIIENNIIKSKKCSGYIAQDISNDIPELNHIIKNGKVLALKYNELQPYITKSIQELDILVNNISNEINIIEKQVETIEKK